MKKSLKYATFALLGLAAAVFAKEQFQCEGKDGVPCESICGGKKKK